MKSFKIEFHDNTVGGESHTISSTDLMAEFYKWESNFEVSPLEHQPFQRVFLMFLMNYEIEGCLCYTVFTNAQWHTLHEEYKRQSENDN